MAGGHNAVSALGRDAGGEVVKRYAKAALFGLVLAGIPVAIACTFVAATFFLCALMNLIGLAPALFTVIVVGLFVSGFYHYLDEH